VQLLQWLWTTEQEMQEPELRYWLGEQLRQVEADEQEAQGQGRQDEPTR
jgi:hypothetical protein